MGFLAGVYSCELNRSPSMRVRAGARPEGRGGSRALPPQFNALAQMWVLLLTMARAGPTACPAAGWPRPSPSPASERGESKGSGASPVQRGSRELDVAISLVTGSGCIGETTQMREEGPGA